MSRHLPLTGAAIRACRPRLPLVAAFTALVLMAAGAARAQPFDAWLASPGDPTNGWINVPDAAVFDISGNFTVEAWVSITNSTVGEDCRSIAGKRWQQTWWLGQCNVAGQPTLRSYLKGSGSLKQGGIVPRGVWTHVAVTFDGSKRRHYINGELAAEFNETGPLPTNNDPIQIGSDVGWVHSPNGSIDEVRLWNVARTTDQIRANLNKRISAQSGLVARYTLDGNGNDVVGGHHGTLQGTGAGFFTFPVAFSCGSNTATSLCLLDRFRMTAGWRTNPTPGTPVDGAAQTVAVANPGSGLFWFFSSSNWEVMIKALNGCGLNNRYWVFSAATTNVFYRVEVLDVRAGVQKIYFNYPGPPAPAVTDVDAFATCP